MKALRALSMFFLAGGLLAAGGCWSGGGPKVGLVPSVPSEYSGAPAELTQARVALAEDKPGKARSILDKWIDANAHAGNPWTPEAHYLRGNARLASGDEEDALYDYERVVKNNLESEFFVPSLEREFDVARLYFRGRGKFFLGVPIVSGVPVAEEIVLRIAERLPGSELAERALLEMADHYARTHDLKMATETYDVFLKLYPRSKHQRFAQERRLYSTIAQFKGPRYDRSILKDAAVRAREFSLRFPEEARRAGVDDGLVARLEESSAQSLLEQAKWYKARGDGASARVVLSRVIRNHPRTAAAQSALDLLGGLAGEPVRPRSSPQRTAMLLSERKPR
jgi:outer membrane protein assembly factor BamD (BamD/ComL family)